MQQILLRGLILLAFGATAAADEASTYLKEVKPLLEHRCFSCHGALAQKSGLRLDTGAAIRQGGDSGAAVVPGDAAKSLLIERVTEQDAALRMPPEGKPLTPQEIDLLRAWIAKGAASPVDEHPQANPADHWAFQKPVRPAVPVIKTQEGDRPENAIDAFVLARLADKGLEPLPEADKPTLLRRVTLDLLGVPPTPEALQQFLADDAPGAYERVVDRLLAHPQYGERWGRHWMDVWRYSDWYGRRSVPDVMNSYPHIWRWRDWIVRSLNSDRGYDQMTLAMLAADEVFPGDDEEVVATGFLVRNWFKWNYESWMKDNVEHTGKAFLGLTLNCCQCHDHKYDPISQREYFQFRAFFEPLELRHDRVPGLPDPGPFKKYVYAQSYGPIAAGLIRVFDEKLDAQTLMYAKGDARNRMEGEPPAVPKPPAVLGGANVEVVPVENPPEAVYPGLKPFVREEELAKAQSALDAAMTALAKARESSLAAERTLAEQKDLSKQPVTAAPTPQPQKLLGLEIATLDAANAVESAEAQQSFAAAQLQALNSKIAADDASYRGIGPRGELAQVASLAERKAAHLGNRVKALAAEQALLLAERAAVADEKLKPKVAEAQKKLDAARQAADASRAALAATSDAYTPLSPVYPSRSTGRRAALARWIASSNNPLTARVAVNHIWMRHFGRGLVETPSNFGLNGKPPSHPELLDWLAVEFMENGWRMKDLHRLMVTSRTYRARSHLGGTEHPNMAVDAENRLYWRANPRRMEAEVVRDSVLACAGTLDETLGGQELDMALGMKSARRSLYFTSHGEAQMQFLDLFDGPTVAECYQRTTSVMPQQALSLANSDLVTLQSRALATTLWKEAESRAEGDAQRDGYFVQAAFQRILSRDARADERDASLEFLREQASTIRSSEASSPGEPAAKPAEAAPPSLDASQRARVDFVHALFNHHDFVNIR